MLDRPLTATLDAPARLALRPVGVTVEQLVEWASGASPDVKGASVGIELASLSVDLARKEFKPAGDVRVDVEGRARSRHEL